MPSWFECSRTNRFTFLGLTWAIWTHKLLMHCIQRVCESEAPRPGHWQTACKLNASLHTQMLIDGETSTRHKLFCNPQEGAESTKVFKSSVLMCSQDECQRIEILQSQGTFYSCGCTIMNLPTDGVISLRPYEQLQVYIW